MGNTYRDEIMVDAPTLYCPLTETAGSTVYDYSGNARNGTIVGGVTPDTKVCPAGGGLAFNGTTGVIQFPSFTPTGDYTGALVLEFWVKVATTAAFLGVYDSAPSAVNTLRNFTATIADWHNGPSTVVFPSLVLSSWNYVCVRYNFATPDIRAVETYINGTYGNSSNAVVGAGWAWTTLRLGNINNGAQGWLAGSLAHFAVYRGGVGGTTSVLTNGAMAGNNAAILARMAAHFEAGRRTGVTY